MQSPGGWHRVYGLGGLDAASGPGALVSGREAPGRARAAATGVLLGAAAGLGAAFRLCFGSSVLVGAGVSRAVPRREEGGAQRKGRHGRDEGGSWGLDGAAPEQVRAEYLPGVQRGWHRQPSSGGLWSWGWTTQKGANRQIGRAHV